jgi:hypothetical protein
MGATGLKEIRYLPLVPVSIERCLRRVWVHHDLTERQCGSKDFDEKCFHPGFRFEWPVVGAKRLEKAIRFITNA